MRLPRGSEGQTDRSVRRWSAAALLRRKQLRRLALVPTLLLALLAFLVLFAGVLAQPTNAAPEAPGGVQAVPIVQAPGQDDIPPGCPGGPADRPTPGTVCPDGSVPVDTAPPTGCPGGPAGRLIPGTVCPNGERPVLPITDIAGCYGGPPEPPEPGTLCPDGSAPQDIALNEELRSWLQLDDSMEHPLTAYDIGCDEGGATDFMRKMWCGMQAMPFAAGKWMVGIGSSVMEWALTFEVAELLTPVAGLLSDVYDVGFIGPINVRSLAWLITMFVVGLAVMTGRVTMGVREFLTTALIFIFGGMMLANPDGYLEGGRDLAQNTSGSLLQATDGLWSDDSADPDEIRGRLTSMLQRAFVAEPYDQLNWGETLEGDCAVARDRILLQGPWSSSETPRQIMRDHGCDEAADYNANPSDNRAMGSALTAAAAIAATLLLLSLALAVFVAQVTLVLLFSSASLIWVVALFPGARGVLWMWISRFVIAVLTTIVAVFLLAWVSVTATVVLDHSSDMEPTQRSLIIIVLALVAYKARSAVDTGLDSARQRFSTMMHRAQSPPPRGRPPMPRTEPQPGAMSVSPFVAGAAAATAATHGGRRFVHGAQKAPTVARGALAASQATDQGVRKAGSKGAQATKTAGRAGRAAIMAPVILPTKIGEAQAARAQRKGGQPPRNDRVRARFAQARQTRGQWRRNVAHPRQAIRDARANAGETDGGAKDWM